MPRSDTQSVEVRGRCWLTAELVRAGLEVAEPVRDRGVDLVAYVDLATDAKQFVGRPIQIKAAMKKVFSVHRKYQRISDLLIVYIWHLDKPAETEAYALTYPEAVALARKLGFTKTNTWMKDGEYVRNKPSRELQRLLKPYRMTSEAWWHLVTGAKRKRRR